MPLCVNEKLEVKTMPYPFYLDLLAGKFYMNY